MKIDTDQRWKVKGPKMVKAGQRWVFYLFLQIKTNLVTKRDISMA